MIEIVNLMIESQETNHFAPQKWFLKNKRKYREIRTKLRIINYK